MAKTLNLQGKSTYLRGEGAGAVGGGVSRLGLADETVSTLLATGEGTARLLELLHGNSGKSRSGVVLGSVVVDLVDGHGGVGDVRLNGLC